MPLVEALSVEEKYSSTKQGLEGRDWLFMVDFQEVVPGADPRQTF